MNPYVWLVLALLSPALFLMLLYSIVVIVALLRADVQDVPSVLEVGVTVYHQIADQLSKLVDKTASILRTPGPRSVEQDHDEVDDVSGTP